VTSGPAVRLERVNQAIPSASPTHDRIQALLAIAIDLPLEPDEAAEIARHLPACARCRTTAAGYARDASNLRDVVLVSPPDRVRVAVLEAAANPAPRGAASGSTQWNRILVVVLGVALAGGLVVVVEQLLR
jgi:anti-sigma factor RsiW